MSDQKKIESIPLNVLNEILNGYYIFHADIVGAIRKDVDAYLNQKDNANCSTCKYKHFEGMCLGCAEHDADDTLISLRHYEKEEETK